MTIARNGYPMKKIRSLVFEYLQIALAILLASIGLKAFLLPNGFLDGGVTGIAILLGEFVPIEISYILPIISIPFFILGWLTLTKRVMIKSVISVLVLAVVIHFENFEAVTNEKLLIAIFGGISLGAGIGLAIKNGAVLDGSEILGIYLHDKFGIPIGTIILLFNTVLFAITAWLISIEIALYSILTFIITGKVIDFVFEGFEDYIGLLIVSHKQKEIQDELLNQVGLGMTIYGGVRGFGSRGEINNVEVIQTVLNRIDSKKVHRIVDTIDEDAFIIEFEVNSVKGGVLRKYLSREKTRTLSPDLYNKDL
ncbi:YitT family protein [Flagellimonas sp.]|uniref:YitT family protein n=2 Tax=Flavobacteriales TaxID=200644 RepID=UPI003BA8492C